MKPGIGAVEVRKQHGKIIVQGLGKTARGQRYIKTTVPIDAESMSDRKFKQELAAAVDEILG